MEKKEPRTPLRRESVCFLLSKLYEEKTNRIGRFCVLDEEIEFLQEELKRIEAQYLEPQN